MILIVVYVALVFIGQALAIAIGITLDNFSKALGLTVFLALYFAVFIVCWKLAVRLTDAGGPLHRFHR